jgi:hypothetical protein
MLIFIASVVSCGWKRSGKRAGVAARVERYEFLLEPRNHLILVSCEPQYNAARECLEDRRAFSQ